MNLKLKQAIKFLLYLSPALLVLVVFQFYPIIKSLLMGFYTKFDYLTDTVFEVGFDNFKYLFDDEEFLLSIKNTIFIVLLSTPLSIVISLIIAFLINSNIKFKRVFQSIYFLPFVTSSVAISVVWSWILNRDYGVLNSFLGLFSVSKVEWLTNPKMTIPILVALSIWKGLGYRIIIFLAALQNIDDKYYQASKIDGANALKRFIYITIPMLKPTLIFISITTIIGSFKMFDEIYIMYDQKPGPLKSGLTIVYYIFHKFNRQWQFSIASAAAFVLFAFILTATLIQMYLTKKKRQ